jgi:hypothetical protein
VTFVFPNLRPMSTAMERTNPLRKAGDEAGAFNIRTKGNLAKTR